MEPLTESAKICQLLGIQKDDVKTAEHKRTHDDNSAGREEFEGGAWILLCLEVETRRQLGLIAKIEEGISRDGQG